MSAALPELNCNAIGIRVGVAVSGDRPMISDIPASPILASVASANLLGAIGSAKDLGAPHQEQATLARVNVHVEGSVVDPTMAVNDAEGLDGLAASEA